MKTTHTRTRSRKFPITRSSQQTRGEPCDKLCAGLHRSTRKNPSPRAPGTHSSIGERSAAAEQAVQEPAVEAAVDGLRPYRLAAGLSADLTLARGVRRSVWRRRCERG